MADGGGAHIASDEGLLARYVLGRIDAAERDRVDRHTAGCPACTEAVRREMRIAAGARRLGRDDLKAELRRRVAVDPGPARWPRILSAAAALGIVAGLGIYYTWFNAGGSLPPRPGETAPLAGKTESLRKDEEKAPVRDLADNAARSKKADNGRGTETPSLRETARSEASGGAPAGNTGGEFWSEGIVEPAAAAAQGAPASGEKSVLLFRSKAAPEEQDRLMEAPPRARGRYILRQQPASALPRERERSGKDRQNVPTRVEQRGNTTTMTMYLDSLVDGTDLNRASVEAVGGDSLVVRLGGKKILYRFPPGQGAQQQRHK